jgi:hypothetical protein
VGRWALAEALVRAVVIEMGDVPVEDSKGMLLVVDQQPVGALFRGRCERTVWRNSWLVGHGEGS